MSQNVSKVLTRITTYDGPADPYDHEISLVDTTDAGNEPDTQNEPRSGSPSPSTKELTGKGTKDSLKGQFARRKSTKYQQDRYGSKTNSDVVGDEPSSRPASIQQPEEAEGEARTQTVDFAPTKSVSAPVERGRTAVENRRRESRKLKEETSEVDILYENQRGAFFCGIPLYAHSSLMPIDPSPWTNKELKPSAVNITNAQVPDPSWEWKWKKWYVDMSHDVDEMGWQYSFAFGRSWVWHGTHPWFHSFVRRRRWLRKRGKRDLGARGKAGTMSDAHHLTGDYFTIHSKRDRSPVDALDGTAKTARPSSYISYPSTAELDGPPEDVKDIASLLRALRFATVDREKIEVVKKFVQQGGEELVYLKDHVRDIMAFLVFQNSRTQLLAYLKRTIDEARLHRESHEDSDKPEGEAESRRIDNLLAAIDAANAEIGGLEYWSDRKHVLKTNDSEDSTTQASATGLDEAAGKQKFDSDPVQEIKGISAKADIEDDDTQQSVLNPARQTSSNEKDGHEEKAVKEDKGKGRAFESEDDVVEQDRLGPDDIFVPKAED